MKIRCIHTIIILSSSVILWSCSNKNETTPIPIPVPVTEQSTQAPAEIPAPVVSANTSGNEGLQLIEGADCLACHKIDAKLIGPSYQEVAKKYTDADIDQLAQKIIEGGKGNWGDIPMTPHEGLSKDHAKQMVKYILSLK
ncbi:cytochrome C [Chryseobacterium lactis]|uniref:Cytochrome C n=1 Tax=Chryseobacterium lactis TaxID=1241981 RepID=A0A3G6RKT5_CHRLC|nr:c-type cytochrome [Chryseobacterium lactis]AZA83182.1 cytochrome C [Chryseobacterium lactis]AZB03567.1 cytochrome C [Chryseobacterium lactis]PNW11927.1 cytochrome C [Chryseobacterium lactis]